MKEFINSEISIISGLFRHNNIRARIIKAENVLNSFVRYHLSLHASQQFTAIEKLQRELSAALAKNRQKYRFPTTEIISVTKPNFGLEVSHPDPKPLLWSIRKTTNLEKDCLLAGISTIDSKPEIIKFDKSPHILIAGMTNAGKSVLLQMLVLSLAANSPSTQFVFIDLKNEDLVPFKKLPNVLSFNSDYQSAINAIDFMLDEKNKRVENNVGNRIVLVIDELAQLAIEKRNAQKLGDLISIGRSKKLNIIAATQSVTKDGGIGSMMKANFSCRLIGQVAPGMSAVATGLANMQAHKLPGQGSFLRIEGNNNHRFQSYFIEPNDVTLLVNHIKQQYKQQNLSDNQPVFSGVNTGFQEQNHRFYSSESETQANTGFFPIGYSRDLNATELAELKRLSLMPEYQFQGKPSLSKLVVKVYGSKNVDTLNKIKEALNNDSIMA